jgi:hypothetical protein
MEAGLGQVITFTPRPRTAPAGQQTAPGQIMLFTGIRYERGEPPQTGSSATPPRPVRRRRG